MNIDEILNSSGEEMDNTMENMDVSLNYDNPELMSSEFFDSVLSLENNMDDGFLSSFEDDINLSSDASSHTDEVLSPRSYYSESDKNSLCTENSDEPVLLNNMDTFDDPLLMTLLDSVNDFQGENISMPVEQPVEKQPTKILIQNPNNKKFIAKPILNTNFKKSQLKMKPQILKVQPILNNGRPVLFPLSVKSIKILNTPLNVANLTSNLKKRKIDIPNIAEEDHVSSTNQYPALTLTQEEKKLLAKEGIQLPTHHPLTKNEERELKRIRRKIRNKISAQDSRKRKKEYVDGLEERVKRGSEENKNLLQRVKALQRQNKTLIAHVNKLQAMIRNSTTSKATPSTCLMVVLLSALLVSIPNMKLFENKQISTEQEQVAIRRSLLSSPQVTEDDTLNMEEFLIFKDEDEYKNKFGEEALDIENSTEKEFSKILEEMEKKYDGFFSDNNNSKMSLFGRVFETFKNFLAKEKPELLSTTDFKEFSNRKVFIEPDIDEYIPVDNEPPSKRMKVISEEDSDSFMVNEGIISTMVNTNYLGIDVKDK